MVHKFVSHYFLPLLSLCLTTAAVSAEESTLLIDKTRGIDNTRSSIIDELSNISESLDSVLPDEKIDPENDAQVEADKEIGPVQDDQVETDTEIKSNKIVEQVNTDTGTSTLLIDNTRGIDNIDDLITPLIQQRNAPTNNIPPDETIPQVSIKETEQVESSTVSDIEEVNTSLPEDALVGTTAISTATEETPALPLTPGTAKDSVDVISQQKTSQVRKDIDSFIWIPKDSDLRILEIRVDTYTFEDVIGAYQYEDIILIPLGALSGILDLSITVSPNFASGFIIKEKNTFSLDTDRNEVILKGISEKYKGELVKNLDGDIYVESRLLGKWLNMEFDIDLYASRVWVRSDEKLPFLARIEREKRIAQALSRLNLAEQQYPSHHEGYKDYSIPFIDQTLRLGQRFSDAGNVTTFNSITYATADLMQHESAWYLSINEQDGVDDFRATFGRTDPEGGLLGSMKAKEYKFGHVAEPRVGLINLPGQLEPGVSVSNYPVGRQIEYDRHRFIGELLPGWEVELYQNNALIGYQQTAVNGQYDFQNIPLLFGNNHFRLVFYGPKGEIKEESKLFQLSQALTKQGEHYYRASTTTDDIGGQRTTAQYDYGISKNLSSTFNLVSIPIQDASEVVQHNYLKAGLTGFWDALLTSASIISDSESGSAVEIDLQTRIKETIIGFNDIHLNNFFSEEYLLSSAEITRSSNLRISTAIPPSFLPRIPVAFGFKRDEYAAGGELLEITNQLSMSTRGVAITNYLTNQQVTGQQATTNGNLQISTNINQVRLRNTIGYALKPDKELTNIALTLDPGQYQDYRLSFGINHSLQQDLTEYSATANKISGKYSLSFGARYNSNNEINLDLSFSVGFGYEPRRERWQQDSRTIANHGSISARFFLDANQDGIFNGGDDPIEGTGVRLNGGYNNERSDEEGILFLTGIPAHNPTNLVIAPETLVDPLWTAALDGVRVVPRPGHAIQIDFPIFTTGEIDGTINLVKNGKQHGVGRVTVELVDQNNRIITTTETAYDGFYILSGVPLGDYRVRIAKTQLSTLGLQSINEESVSIKADNPFINGIDFNIEAIETN